MSSPTILSDPRVRSIPWRDLTRLKWYEVAWELSLSAPWLVLSLAMAGRGLYAPAMAASFVFFLTGLRQVHNASSADDAADPTNEKDGRPDMIDRASQVATVAIPERDKGYQSWAKKGYVFSTGLERAFARKRDGRCILRGCRREVSMP